ncbi:DNA primase [Streptomyces sp. VNUA24]|uniref:DNA primase n=1 Tax=Streptomyces sp. VNUA24 TaxID=3031131 RepID=UPI0023B7C069|nr:DNA primase [Streptomyces sp. VNUA24]WEH14409.1 DNA primase [Streptomyces sp. VNUA24]
MNRIGLGLAVGAGYVLGRTKKMKLAFAVGTMVAGKRMQLSPRALADLVSQQLLNNPQFKEIGDQLRGDLRGVGKAATGALVERQIEGLADRLHGRTSQVRDQLAGVAPDVTGRGGKDRDDDEYEDEDERDASSGARDEDEDEEPEEKPARRRPAKKSQSGAEGKPAAKKSAPAKKAAAPARKTASKRTAAKKTAPGRAPAKKTARKATGTRATRGGGDDD